jgi:hypothetical protein
MKELYISPVAELICFAPAESLATNNTVEFDALLNKSGLGSAISSVTDNEDLDIGIGI